MLPKLFVMWDRNIKPYKSFSYSDYIKNMNNFAKNLESDFSENHKEKDIELFLMQSLGYKFKKPLSKYLDEFNWYIAFGKNR